MPASPAPAPQTAPATAQPPQRHPVDQVLPPVRLFTSGLQHVAAMYAGVVAPPLVIGKAVGLSATELTFLVGASLFTAGLATLLQTIGFWKVGARLPFVNGVSFAGVAPMVAIADSTDHRDSLPVMFGAVIVAGALGFVAAPYFSKLVRFFPPVVTGSVITLIGVSLLPVAIGWIAGNDPAHPAAGLSDIALAAITLVVVLALRRLLTGFLQQIAVLIGLVVGTVIAVPFGKTDFTPITKASVIGFPTPFHFGAPQFQIPAIVSMCIVMLVCLTESTADILALGKVVEKPADEATLAAGLRADTLGSAISPLFNGFANSAFAQNIGLVAITRVRSRFVVAAGGMLLIVMGLCPVLASLIALVPGPVLGGAGIVLFGTVAASGVKTLAEADLDDGNNLLVMGVALGVGIIPIVAEHFYDGIDPRLQIVLKSGISTGCLVAVVLNLLFNHLGRKRALPDGAEQAEALAEAVPSSRETVELT
ncbi:MULTISPECIES: nucleobase:cation symporter-2 family protein [Streptomycetaceae]|uniref:Permease n=1 Tax=Streptantibioticus cattleyicolor (strain ATCC 35852 / DSM 46488 / JCM 4925 / NBRC 14057 / NRRL 8057) TaxID=1003195 RepID=F8JXP3_STREN|nr:nucleobase:cation symporter-2 family protein [Streptantibioticus cattleyicolor]AEW97146.1 permease [Streptantibioticus cattleyicolor NRRL 8057 = DSM 46488]MYS61604.1 purine permease [Streptomyces sp. SID5468]CCB77469.1 uric acid permease [Streptantibioticus cattleyicolor NRRL 8057 = DSM 46488]